MKSESTKGSAVNKVNVYERMLSSVIPSEWVSQGKGKKHWIHVSGVQVKYDHNRWAWQVIGGAKCGLFFDTKWSAQTEGTKHLG